MQDSTPTEPDTRRADRDGWMVAHEEQLHVHTRMRATGRVVVRKVVVEREETITVKLRREELRIEEEPVHDAHVVDGDAGRMGGQEIVMVLHEERPVVSTELIPVERVRVTTDLLTEQVTLTEEVRRENIDLEAPRGAAS